MSTCGVIRTYHKTDCDGKYCSCNEKEGIQLKEEYFQNAGKREGVYKSYYSNGQTSEKSNYIDGKREGNSKSYYANGNLLGKCNYISGKIEGTYKVYYSSGNIKIESNYNNDRLHGEYKSYSDNINAQIINKLNYVNGNQEGLQTYYKNDEDYVELLCINDKISSLKTYGNKIANIDVIFKEPINYGQLCEFVSVDYLEEYIMYF